MPRVALTLSSFVLVSTALAGNWPQFRGPAFNGSAEEQNLPTTWSTTDNVVWATDLPGASAATPVVWGDRVFVSSTDASNDTLLAICLDRVTGKVLWSHVTGEGIRRDSRSNYAAPTPATDGDVVVFFYGNGNLVAFDYAGEVLWKRSVTQDYGEFAFQWTFSTSPLIYKGRLYLQVLQRDRAVRGNGFTDRPNESYLLALEPRTGRELWRVVRPSKAREESREAFTTPVPFTYNGRDELLIAGGDALTGHDPATGEEFWRWGTWNPTRIEHWRLVPSPVGGGGVVLVCAPKTHPIYAIRAGGTGILNEDAVAWSSVDTKAVSSDVPTPAYSEGDFFVLNKDRRILSRIDPTTGNIKWQSKRLPGNAAYEASPLVADGKVYLMNFSANVVVMDTETGDIISEIAMDEPHDDPTRSTIVAAQGQLFIRTTNKLYCIASGASR